VHAAEPVSQLLDEAMAFIAEVMQLESEVREVGQHLDRLESNLRQALNDLARQRYEEHR
jgi:DNA anti-recombination protein RmuC